MTEYLRDDFMGEESGSPTHKRECSHAGYLYFKSGTPRGYDFIDNSLRATREVGGTATPGWLKWCNAAGTVQTVAPAAGMQLRAKFFVGEWANGLSLGFGDGLTNGTNYTFNWDFKGQKLLVGAEEAGAWYFKYGSANRFVGGQGFGPTPSVFAEVNAEYPIEVMLYIRDVDGTDVTIEAWIRSYTLTPSAPSYSNNWMCVGRWTETITGNVTFAIQPNANLIPALTVWYDGAEATATVEVDDSTEVMTLKAPDSASPGITIDLSSTSYDDINELVAYINTQTGWNATVMTSATMDSCTLRYINPTNCIGFANRNVLYTKGSVRIDEMSFVDGTDGFDPADTSKWRCVRSPEDPTDEDENMQSMSTVYVAGRDKYIVSLLQGKESAGDKRFGVRLFENADADCKTWTEIERSSDWFAKYTDSSFGYWDCPLLTDGNNAIVAFVTKWDATTRYPAVSTSTDGGVTWSAWDLFASIPAAITSGIVHLDRPGIRLSSGRWLLFAHDDNYNNFLLFSDEVNPSTEEDWTWQQIVNDDATPGTPDWVEPSGVQLPNGDVLIVFRDQNNQYAGIMTVTESGSSFTTSSMTVCDGKSGRPYFPTGKSPSVMVQDDDKTLLFIPVTPSDGTTTPFRDHLAIYESSDNGTSWALHDKSPYYQGRRGKFTYPHMGKKGTELFGTFGEQEAAVYFSKEGTFFGVEIIETTTEISIMGPTVINVLGPN